MSFLRPMKEMADEADRIHRHLVSIIAEELGTAEDGRFHTAEQPAPL